MNYSDINHFWFKELTPEQWWVKDQSLDDLIRERYADVHQAAALGECYHWREEPQGWLAEIIVLDQFSRNIYRDNAQAFAQDAQALTLAQEAISSGATAALAQNEKYFVYMPFMHSESVMMHKIAVGLFADLGIEKALDYAQQHKAIIDRFGRYPHRNAILGRESTPEEIEFLSQPGSSF